MGAQGSGWMGLGGVIWGGRRSRSRMGVDGISKLLPLL